MTEHEQNSLVSTLEQLQRDLGYCQKRIATLYARYARNAPGAPDAMRDARVVNTQDKHVNIKTNKQKQTCVCVDNTVSVDRTEDTHTHKMFWVWILFWGTCLRAFRTGTRNTGTR